MKLRQVFKLNILPEKYFNYLTISTDLKLANILTGIMSHSSNHPVTWCNLSKNKLCENGELYTIATPTIKKNGNVLASFCPLRQTLRKPSNE